MILGKFDQRTTAPSVPKSKCHVLGETLTRDVKPVGLEPDTPTSLLSDGEDKLLPMWVFHLFEHLRVEKNQVHF